MIVEPLPPEEVPVEDDESVEEPVGLSLAFCLKSSRSVIDISPISLAKALCLPLKKLLFAESTLSQTFLPLRLISFPGANENPTGFTHASAIYLIVRVSSFAHSGAASASFTNVVSISEMVDIPLYRLFRPILAVLVQTKF